MISTTTRSFLLVVYIELKLIMRSDMDLTMITVWYWLLMIIALLILGGVGIINIMYNNIYWVGGRGLPPGPAGLPILGHLHKLGALPHQTFARLSKIHGPLMCLRLGSVPVLVASSPAMAMHILHTHDKIFAGRPRHVSAPLTVNGGWPSMFLSQPGPFWKLLRHIFATDLVSTNRMDHFRPVRVLEIATLLRSVLAAQGTPLGVREKLHAFNIASLSRMALGKPLHEFVSADAAAKSLHNIEAIVMEVLSLEGAFNVGDYIPCLAWMDVQGYGKRAKEVAGKVSSVFQAVIENRRHFNEENGNGPSRDFLDSLLLQASSSANVQLIEDGHIRAVLLEMFLAGVDTSAIAIEWALAELLANPNKLRRVQEELDEKVGTSRIVEETDLPNLPYLQATVTEAMRLHPVVPLLAAHMSLDACQIEGYHIPANTSVYVNVWAIHRDPSVWENPLEFRPERFLEGNLLDATLLGRHSEYLPFGSGRRRCPGWKLGLLNVQIVLASLLHAFDWTLTIAGGPSLSEKSGLLVALEHPLSAIPTPRLPRHLFNTPL